MADANLTSTPLSKATESAGDESASAAAAIEFLEGFDDEEEDAYDDGMDGWTDAVAKDGRRYWYHPDTRESSWTSPKALQRKRLDSSGGEEAGHAERCERRQYRMVGALSGRDRRTTK